MFVCWGGGGGVAHSMRYVKTWCVDIKRYVASVFSAMRRVSFQANDPISGFHISDGFPSVLGTLDTTVIVAVSL